ncbi:amidase [Neorhizobium galegae]|uniref:amidase n=1 Tax=Neorhizobium galegae TaxID=399 RepID=UPI00210695AD|nr:amidase [Neorhizobium galegae]MCQ1838813.1 amidase [Neorhizobium galegae]
MIDPMTMTARKIAADVASGSLHPHDVTDAYLDHIARLEPQLNAFAWLDPDAARAGAEAAVQGPLAGVPFGIKDVFDTVDMPTGYGSAAYAGSRPVRDASAVHLTRMAGGIALGKTVTTEFASAAPGPTCNPFDPARSPGGSSSGSAAGLAAGFFPLAFGTQTSGSTLRPASFCGIVGYKASRGLIDRTGVKPLAESLDIVGVMARDVRDCALFASVLARRNDLAPTDDTIELPRVGLFAYDLADTPSTASMDILDNVAGILGGVETLAKPDWWDDLGQAQADVFAWEASAALGPERDLHWGLLKPRSHEFFARHEGITFERWRAGINKRDSAMADLDSLFGDRDLLITQAAPGEAPIGLGATGAAAYNIRWTLLGTPSLSIPAGLGPSGLPIGIQLVARPGDDARLLACAAAIEDILRLADVMVRPERIAIPHAS